MSRGNRRRGLTKKAAGGLRAARGMGLSSAEWNRLRRNQARSPRLVQLVKESAAKGKVSVPAFTAAVKQSMLKKLAEVLECKVAQVLPITLIEGPADQDSALAEAVVDLGGAALRISRNDARASAPAPAPRLKRGKVVTWKLDLNRLQHRSVLNAFLKKARMVPGTRRLHFHSSPWCAKTSSIQRIFARTPGWAPVALRWARAAHCAFRANKLEEELKSATHEQPQRATAGSSRTWPWAIHRWTRRVPVAGCMVGLCGDVGDGRGELPVCKTWCIEAQRDITLRSLLQFRCPGGHARNYVLSEAGRRGIGAEASGHYPLPFGFALAMSVSPVEAMS